MEEEKKEQNQTPSATKDTRNSIQKFMDNPWLLLLLGLLIPLLSYTLWGLLELLHISSAKLP